MALKPFWNKKYHLGMTGDEVKAGIKAGATIPKIEDGDAGKAIVVNESESGFELAEVGGGGSANVAYISLNALEMNTLLAGGRVLAKAAVNYDLTKPNPILILRSQDFGDLYLNLTMATLEKPEGYSYSLVQYSFGEGTVLYLEADFEYEDAKADLFGYQVTIAT